MTTADRAAVEAWLASLEPGTSFTSRSNARAALIRWADEHHPASWLGAEPLSTLYRELGTPPGARGVRWDGQRWSVVQRREVAR